MVSFKFLLSENRLSSRQKILLLVFIFITSMVLLGYLKPQTADWHDYFYPSSRSPYNPYSIDGFMNPPWTAILLSPIGLLPYSLGALVNSSLAIVVFAALVLYKDGSMLSLALTVTSVPVFFLAGIGNIDWLPALGFFFANEWGVILLLTKPQSGIFAGIDWFFRQQDKVRYIVIPIILVIFSFLVWGNWPNEILSNMNKGMGSWNFSLFPWSIPLGLGLILFIIVKRPENGELLGTLATFCMVPYFSGHSLPILFTLIILRYPKLGSFLWVVSWALFFIEYS